MKRRTLLNLTAIILLGAGSSWAAALAVSSRSGGVVNFYDVQNGGYLAPSKSIPIGKGPNEMCLDPNGKRLFVGVNGEKRVAVLDLDSKTVVGSLSAPEMADLGGCIVSPDSSKLYSVDKEKEVVFVFSIASKQLLKKIPVGKEPRRGIFSPDGKKLLISNEQSNSLSIIDPSSDTVVNTIKTGTGPRSLAYSPDGKVLAVSVVDDDCIAFFWADTLEFRYQVAVAQSPNNVLWSKDSQYAYALGRLTDAVSVVHVKKNGARAAYTFPIPHGPTGKSRSWGLVSSSDGKYLYASNTTEGVITLVDTMFMNVVNGFASPDPVDMVYLQ